MMLPSTPLLLCLLAVFAPSFVLALDQVDPHAKAGYFVTNISSDATYIVGMNFVQNGDIYLHMSAPTTRAWVGVGIGENMAGAFMLVAYASANGTGMTTSPRRARHGHSEPEWAEDAEFEKIFSDAYAPNCNTAAPGLGGIQIAHGVCKNCSGFTSADYANTALPFIFAVGPEMTLHSDALDAPLRRHEYYGHFTLDMTIASSNASTTYGRVPAPNLNDTNAVVADSTFASAGSSGPSGAGKDSDWGPTLHAVVMCLAFILVFPLGALVLRVLKSVLWHAVAQAVGVLLVLVGFGTAVRISLEYNRSRSFATSHQILGLLVFCLLLLQLGLGLAGHAIFRRTRKPSIVGKIHMFLGPSLILLALVNGGLGLDLADSPKSGKIAYGVVVTVVGLVVVAVRGFVHFRQTPRRYKPEDVSDTLDPYAGPGAGSYYPRASTSPSAPGFGFSGQTAGYEHLQTPVSAMSAGHHAGWEMGDASFSHPAPARASVAPLPRLTLQTGSPRGGLEGEGFLGMK
ncbi:hypothetical protein LTR36_004793 [Oleoguttula mirabilis]|uniref:Cytochrome b561 domain-containing protein n=1 Tax=Oleoguttula mirabilis TaxID=1507867 RepID=A0AAV9JEZ0_9PEZI|nr:hypothetical protein LTR36_004793 [Oleoguttula mirabilis]